MFLDAGAVVAVLLDEPDAPALLKAMEAARGQDPSVPPGRGDAADRRRPRRGLSRPDPRPLKPAV